MWGSSGSILGATAFSVSHNVAVRWCSLAGYTYNTPAVILATELCKIAVASVICIGWFRQTPVPGPIRWGFSVNAGLYAVTNVLTFTIVAQLDISLYTVLIQHKMLFVLLLSTIVLQRAYTVSQWGACMLVAIGIMLTQYSPVGGEHNHLDARLAGLIAVQGFCSSLSGVWIEKMMKEEGDRDTSLLYTFLTDSLQMYVFSLPVYIAMVCMGSSTHTLPAMPTMALAINGACCGLFVGSIFKYFSATVRALVHGAVVIATMAVGVAFFAEQVGSADAGGASLVVAGIVLFQK